MTGSASTTGTSTTGALRIDHVALWVKDLADSRDFYLRWFGGRANGEYHNPRTGLRTTILTFGDRRPAEDGVCRGRLCRILIFAPNKIIFHVKRASVDIFCTFA